MKRALAVLFCLVAALALAGPGYQVHKGRAVAAAGDVTAPELSSAVIVGDELTLNWSEAVSAGSGFDLADFDVDMSTTGAGIAVASVDSGDGSAQWVCTTASAAVNGETVDIDYAGAADGVEDAAGNDLATFASESVTNSTPSTCATTDTAIAHDETLEGFQTETTGYESGWFTGETNTDGTIDHYYDSSAIAFPDEACDRSLRVVANAANGNEVYASFDRGSTIDTDTSDIDIVFYVFIEDAPDANGNTYNIWTCGNSATPGTSNLVTITINNTGGEIRLTLTSNGTTAAYVTTQGSVVRIAIHIDITAAESTVTWNAESPVTFTRTGFDLRYFSVGIAQNLGAGENGAYVFDVIAINTP